MPYIGTTQAAAVATILSGGGGGSPGGGGGGGGGDEVTAQRWRILADGTQGSLGMNTLTFAEMDYLDTSGNAISTGGATITESNTYGASEDGEKLFDGDLTTNWATPRGASDEEEWVEVDFGSPVEVAGVSITARDDTSDVDGAPVSFKIQYFDGGWLDFIDVADFYGWATDGTAGSGVKMTLFKNGRIWRLGFTDTEHGTFLGMEEVEFRESADVAETNGSGVNDGFSFASWHWGAPDTLDESAGYAFDGGADHFGGNISGSPLSGVIYLYRSFLTRKDIEQVYIKARSGNPTHAPRAFTVAYSDDGGGSWTTVSTVSGESAWSEGEERTYPISY